MVTITSQPDREFSPSPGLPWNRLVHDILVTFGFLPDPLFARRSPLAVDRPVPSETEPQSPTDVSPVIQETESVQPEPAKVHMPGETAPEADALRWRRHPLLRIHTADEGDCARSARRDAVRGLFAARDSAYDTALYFFTRAAECPDVDLTSIPGFWKLDRRGLETAVQAYEHADRVRDAAALNARLRTHFRPRALAPIPANVTVLGRPETVKSGT